MKPLWNETESEVGKIKCILITARIGKRATWDKCGNVVDTVCDFTMKSKTV